MWIPEKVADYLKISKEVVDDQRVELSALRAERDALRNELMALKTNFDWLRIRVNALEVENKALIERAYDIRLPAPEITRQLPPQFIDPPSVFDDIGDDLAKAMSLPVYGSPTPVL